MKEDSYSATSCLNCFTANYFVSLDCSYSEVSTEEAVGCKNLKLIIAEY